MKMKMFVHWALAIHRFQLIPIQDRMDTWSCVLLVNIRFELVLSIKSHVWQAGEGLWRAQGAPFWFVF